MHWCISCSASGFPSLCKARKGAHTGSAYFISQLEIPSTEFHTSHRLFVFGIRRFEMEMLRSGGMASAAGDPNAHSPNTAIDPARYSNEHICENCERILLFIYLNLLAPNYFCCRLRRRRRRVFKSCINICIKHTYSLAGFA